MKAWVELWVRLKVVDLVAQTAWMTFTEKLDFENDLLGLIRYSYWGMNAEGTGNDELMEEVDRVIRMDSAFTNQNKHLYRLVLVEAAPGDVGRAGSSGTGGASAAGDEEFAIFLSRGDLALERDYPLHESCGETTAPAENVFAFDCLVRERKSDRERGYCGRLNARLSGVTVSDVKAGEVWRLIVRATSPEEAAGKIESMLITRSRREGLILNPHYQKYEIVSSRRLERKEKVR